MENERGRPPGYSVNNPSPDTIRKQNRFLLAYRGSGVISKAAKTAGISAKQVSSWRRADFEFLDNMDEAKQAHNDKLESMMFDLIAEQHKNLDYKSRPTLLIFALNGAMPNKYKQLAEAEGDHAKELLLEWRKAARNYAEQEQNQPEAEPEVEKTALQQAKDILESKRGSLDDSTT